MNRSVTKVLFEKTGNLSVAKALEWFLNKKVPRINLDTINTQPINLDAISEKLTKPTMALNTRKMS